jgi:hypothetical protein
MRKLYFWLLVVFATPVTLFGQAQGDYRTAQDGNWNAVSTWQVYNNGDWRDLGDPSAGSFENVIPTSASGVITIQSHDVFIPNGFSVTIDQTTVSVDGRIDVQTGGSLVINAVANALIVNGDLVARDLSSITGTSSTRVVFNAGSNYFHLFTTTQGIIPLAAWNAASNLLIRGYTTFATATSTGNWTQSFGNVEWRCSSQANSISLAGLLRTVTGDLTVLDTNGQQLRLSTTSNPTINISGDVNVEGNSSILFSTTGSATTVNVTGDFNFNPTTGLTSYLATTGVTTVNVFGDFTMDAGAATLNLVNSTSSSGTGTLYIRGDFNLVSGIIKEGNNDSATSTGRIWFTNTGQGTLHRFINTGTISNRISYRLVQATDTLHLVGESQLIGHTGSSLTVNGGFLMTENTHADGAVQTGSGTGNGAVRVATRSFSAGSTIIYYGDLTMQYIGNGHPSTIKALIDNPAGVGLNSTTATTITLAALTVTNGNLYVDNDNLAVNNTGAFVNLDGGDLVLQSDAGVRTGNFLDVNLDGGNMVIDGGPNAATVTVNGTLTQNVGDVIINSGTADATLRLMGDFVGTGGNFYFSGNNSRFFVLGSGPFTRTVPLAETTTLKFIGINRSGEIIALPEAVTVTTDVSIPAGTLQTTADLIIMGDLNINTGGTLNFSNSTLEIQSQYNNTYTGGELFANSSSTLLMSGSGAVGTINFAAGGNALSKLELDRPTTGTLVTLNSTLTVYDSIKLVDGIFRNLSGLTVQPGLVFLRHSNASMSGVAALNGPYNLLFQGTSLTTSSEILGSIQNMTSEVTGTVTLNNAIAMSGDILISSGTFTSGANAIATAVQFTNNGVFNAPSSTLTLSGDFINDGTFNSNSGTVSFAGVNTVGGTSSTIFHSLNITAAGTLDAPPTLQLTGNFTNLGAFTHNGGLVTFSGSARQDIGGNGFDFYSIDVTNTTAPYSVSLETSANLAGTLTLSNNATFFADGLTTLGDLTILSADDQPTTQDGRIAAIPSSASFLGEVTVQRFMQGNTGGHNRYISSPVSGATAAEITGDYAVKEIKWYDETVLGIESNGYKLVAGTDELVSGRGYLVLPTTANVTVTWDVEGPLTNGENQGSVDLNVTHTPSTPVQINADGWNLVGNPYPSGIGWGINAGWTRSNVGATITVRDLGGPSPKYKTYTYNGADGTGTLPNGVISMGQSFWVYVNPGGGQVIVHETAKTGASGAFYRERGPSSKQLILALTNDVGDEDNTFLKTNAAATEDFDPDFDAYQFKNDVLNINVLDKERRPMLMHTLPAIPEDFVAPLELSTSKGGTYTISFEHAQEFLNGMELYLIDEQEQVATAIHTPGSSYTFSISSATTDDARFKLKRKPEFETSFDEFSVHLFPNPTSRELTISTRGAGKSQVTIMDTKGTVMSQASIGMEGVLNIADLPKGMYIVRIVSGEKVLLRKIVKE